jgi:hypothetical protein
MKTATIESALPEAEKEKCRLLLLKAMDVTLPRQHKAENLMDYIERRQAHRAQFDEISEAAGWGPLIRRATPTATPAAGEAEKGGAAQSSK